MEQETVCELRRTNIFLRVVLFLFTLIIVGAAAALFLEVFLSRPGERTMGVFLLLFAAISYAAAEFAVSRAGLYRYGIEEALAVCSVGFLAVGMAAAFGDRLFSPVVPSAGAIFSLWIWHRFGLAYAFPAAMIFALWLPGHWTSSHDAQHLIVAMAYGAGLIAVAEVRSHHSFTYLDEGYSIAEALLWLGIYLAINLRLSSVRLPLWWLLGARSGPEFSRPFYWATWVLIWCLPPVILARGLRRKDRFVIVVGGIAAILTLVGYSNNDTIVVFDRIRENLKLMRRESLADVVNRSINQTLSRTILTAGLTFLTVLALYLFGGEVLHGFSFALVIGILIGTYSSIAIAAPILVAYQEWRSKKGKGSGTLGGSKLAANEAKSIKAGRTTQVPSKVSAGR